MAICKKKIFFFGMLFSVVTFQCKTSYESKSQRSVYKSIYLDQFKLTYFRKLLIKGFNGSDAINAVIKFDNSGFTEPILNEDDLDLIDSLTTVDNLKMQLDSANTIGRVAEGAEGKKPLGFILNKLSSKWLDSLAQKRYKSSGIRSWAE
jgi:hypothetical protein